MTDVEHYMVERDLWKAEALILEKLVEKAKKAANDNSCGHNLDRSYGLCGYCGPFVRGLLAFREFKNKRKLSENPLQTIGAAPTEITLHPDIAKWAARGPDDKAMRILLMKALRLLKTYDSETWQSVVREIEAVIG